MDIFRKFLPLNQIHPWEPWWELKGIAKLVSLRRLIALRKTLHELKPAQAYCVWADSRVHALMRQAGATQTFSFPVNQQNFYAHERPWRRRRMKLGQFLGYFAPLTHPLQRADYQQSHLKDWQQLTVAAGLQWNPTTPWFQVTPHVKASAFRNPNRKLWLIHPGGRLATKRWPLDRFQHLLNTTFRERTSILIEPPDSHALISDNPDHLSLRAHDFDELLSLVQAADAVLCNDSLVSHLAASLGKPVWTIFGSANPSWFAPYENAARVIACDVCSYRPCIDRCVHSSPICLEAVSVEQVAQSLPSDAALG
ncbi:MAG: glycosyltransferase family 9 protein [Chthoniobacterales bacterium]